MTRPHSLPLRAILTSLLLILASLALAGCGLFGGGSAEEAGPMTVQQALDVEPVDGRPTVLEEMGPPDAFTIRFEELEGQIVRWESWSYFDFATQFDFIDGELLWTVQLEEVEDGSIFAHWYDPLTFRAGMSAAEVRELLADQELAEVDLSTLDLEGGLALAGDQILLGFQDDGLVYVETVILSPLEGGQPLADAAAGAEQTEEEEEAPPTPEPTLEPTAEPTAEPTPEPTPEPTTPVFSRFEDDFESEAALAIPLFAEGFMEFGNIDGLGVLTAHTPGVLLAYYQEPVLEDFILEVDIRPLGFIAKSEAGVIFRSEDPAGGAFEYYWLALIPSSQQISFRAWYGGEWALWETAAIPPQLVPQYGVYRLKIDAQGETFRIYLSDQLAAEFSSGLMNNPGSFGLVINGARDPETVTFDNLVISQHP